jgi:hypothetical protein
MVEQRAPFGGRLAFVGERSTSMKPSGFCPCHFGPTSRNLPPGVCDAEPIWWVTVVNRSTI